MSTLKPEDIKDFPALPEARIIENGRHVYVVCTTYAKDAAGKRHKHVTTLGKVVEGQYYPMDEYRLKFTRAGEPRVKPTAPKRTYTRRKPLEDIKRAAPAYSLDQSAEAKAAIADFPHHIKGARLLKVGSVLYVVSSTYYRADGRSHERRVYHGRVIDGRYYSTEDYHRLFTRSGRLRSEQA